MKYDVLFVHPQNYGNLQTYLKLPSLELCQISAVLNQNGYSNKLVDCFIDGRDIQELDNMLPIESPRIVLIYCSEYKVDNIADIKKKTSAIYVSCSMQRYSFGL